MGSRSYSEVAVVMPAFNEADGLKLVLDKLLNVLPGAQIIVVDDGSSDDTAAIIKAHPTARLIQHPNNLGYGAALRTGIEAASRKYVVWADADGQHRPQDIQAVADQLLGDNLDFCIGVRAEGSYEEPQRKLGKWVLRHAVRLAAGQSLPDFNSGLRGFRVSVIRKYLHLLPKGFGASTTTSLIMLERNYLAGEVPIFTKERLGQSSVRQVRDGMRTLILVLRIFLLFKPMQFFGCMGIVLMVSGLAYGIGTAIFEGLGFPVLGAVVVLAGLQTLFLGLIMDQVSALRRERFK